MTDIIEVTTKEQFRRVAELAKVIWTEHYTAIIGSEQVSYMLDKFQSAAAIEKQVKQNCQYYLLVNDEIDAGYFCHYPKGGNLFLSKLYVLKTLRGHGIGKIGLKAIEETAISKGYEQIEL
ncbi:MAG: GNAT family N-acetyltransferase, partial [Marinoscillum sp.]